MKSMPNEPDDTLGRQHLGDPPRLLLDDAAGSRSGREAAAQVHLVVGAAEDLVVGRHAPRPRRRARCGAARSATPRRAGARALRRWRPRPRSWPRTRATTPRRRRRWSVDASSGGLRSASVDDGVALAGEAVVQLDHDRARRPAPSSSSVDRGRRARSTDRGPRRRRARRPRPGGPPGASRSWSRGRSRSGRRAEHGQLQRVADRPARAR